jgi:hypothetical protein
VQAFEFGSAAAPLFEIELDPADMARAEKLLAGMEGMFQRALAKAINTGMQAMRDEMARRVSETTGLGVNVIKERVWGRKGRITSLWARARAGKIGWPLERFPHTQTAEGVSIKLPGGAVIYPHTFVATMPGGHEGVFRRKPSWRWKPVQTERGAELHGLPIERARTDAVTDAIIRIAAEPAILALGVQTATTALDAETQKRLQEAAA